MEEEGDVVDEMVDGIFFLLAQSIHEACLMWAILQKLG